MGTLARQRGQHTSIHNAGHNYQNSSSLTHLKKKTPLAGCTTTGWHIDPPTEAKPLALFTGHQQRTFAANISWLLNKSYGARAMGTKLTFHLSLRGGPALTTKYYTVFKTSDLLATKNLRTPPTTSTCSPPKSSKPRCKIEPITRLVADSDFYPLKAR